MGGIQSFEKSGYGGRPPGKIEASLNERLSAVEWGEYSYHGLFEPVTVKRKLDKDSLDACGKVPVFSSESTNNGIIGYTSLSADFIVDDRHPIYVIFGDHTRNFNFAVKSFCVADNVKVLRPSINSMASLMFITSAWRRCIPDKGYARHWRFAEEASFFLPTKHGKIDFVFMENFIAELEAQRCAELEAYLSVTGLKDTHLSLEEEQALADFDKIRWGLFNLEELFGKSTRGKRLKSADRIPGTLPFVTAGEAEEGVSAFIGNDVELFLANTTTIDMFGSAKYRSYTYGGDDHIAVVHTEDLPKYASIFVTTAIHKSSHNGQFDYGHNFYAKDADALFISLPMVDPQIPDYDKMATLISAIHKLVIRDVVSYSDKRLAATKKAIDKYM